MNTRIKEIRESLGMTQEAFGNRIGSARNTIANYESGNRTPSNAVILAICKEFCVNEEWLRDGTGDKWQEELDDFVSVTVNIDKYDAKAKKFIMDYWKLPEKDKELIINFIERFIKK